MNPSIRWPSFFLRFAAIYHLLWGAWVVVFPNTMFDWTGTERLNHPAIWQGIGLLALTMGMGYGLASGNPRGHWLIVAVGLAGKVLSPIVVLQAMVAEDLPWRWGWFTLVHDVIWWCPMIAILYETFREQSDPRNRDPSTWTLDQANRLAIASNGKNLATLSHGTDVLLIFLRHAGCTFCRETLDELRKRREEWTSKRFHPVVVHMGSNAEGDAMMRSFALADIPTISDPDCRLFRAYELPRGSIGQLFGLSIWIRGFVAAIWKGYGFGKLVGDGFQLSGAFWVRDGRILASAPSRDAADSCSWKAIVAATPPKPSPTR